jgi:hypothetical protein
MSPPAAILVISVALNAAVGWAWLQARDRAATALQQRDQARSDASICSDATDDLRTLADARAKEAKTAQAKARAAALAAGARATQELATPAAVPGDDYASVQARLQRWEQGRAAP